MTARPSAGAFTLASLLIVPGATLACAGTSALAAKSAFETCRTAALAQVFVCSPVVFAINSLQIASLTHATLEWQRTLVNTLGVTLARYLVEL
jgi:hypothetical protein